MNDIEELLSKSNLPEDQKQRILDFQEEVNQDQLPIDYHSLKEGIHVLSQNQITVRPSFGLSRKGKFCLIFRQSSSFKLYAKFIGDSTVIYVLTTPYFGTISDQVDIKTFEDLMKTKLVQSLLK